MDVEAKQRIKSDLWQALEAVVSASKDFHSFLWGWKKAPLLVRVACALLVTTQFFFVFWAVPMALMMIGMGGKP
jgi:hypothetical protein